MPGKKLLQDFPALATWYSQASTVTAKNQNISEIFALRTCELLNKNPEAEDLKKWIRHLFDYFESSKDLKSDYIFLTELFHAHDVDFTEIIGEISHLILTHDLGHLLLPAMQTGARKANLAALRFLSAWTALNCDLPQVCIAECDLVDEPFAPIYTIQGQALLETGKPNDALDCFDVATSLAPHEIMGWFQKAKALHVLDRHLEAFEALRICEGLAPGNGEVALFMAMVAINTSGPRQIYEHAWTSLLRQISTLGHVSQIPLKLIRLAILLKDSQKAAEIASHPQLVLNLETREDMSDLTNILRSFQDHEWMDIAAKILAKTRIVEKIVSKNERL